MLESAYARALRSMTTLGLTTMSVLGLISMYTDWDMVARKCQQEKIYRYSCMKLNPKILFGATMWMNL